MSTGILHLHLAFAILLFVLLLAGRVPRLRAVSVAAALLLLATGVYNFATRMQNPPPGWHMWIGIKTLLALHVIAVVLLMARGGQTPEKSARNRKVALITGGIAMAIGLYFSNFAR